MECLPQRLNRLRKNSSGVRSLPPAAGSRFDFTELTARVELVPFPKSAGNRVFPQAVKAVACRFLLDEGPSVVPDGAKPRHHTSFSAASEADK